MEDLRLAIIVLGAFAIVGVLVHGIWTIRKNSKEEIRDEPGHRDTPDESGSDHEYVKISIDDPLLNDPLIDDPSLDDSLKERAELDGNVNLKTSAKLSESSDPLLGDQPLYEKSDLHHSLENDTKLSSDSTSRQPSSSASKAEHTPRHERHHYDADDIGEVRLVARQPTPEKNDNVIDTPQENEPAQVPEPPSSLLKKEDEIDRRIDLSIDIDDAPKKRTTPEPKVTTETKKVGGKKSGIAEKARKIVGRGETAKKAEKDQIRLDLDEKVDLDEASSNAQKEQESPEQEVLIISVKASDGRMISGAALLPALLTLGFKFGEHNMFHRHANSNGKGPKLFSLANMFNPGTFDIDNMEKFSTAGISLFMILPIEADPHQVFNMMHNAARKLADEFDLQILDGRRSALTKQSLQQYVEKIREFERRRMIKRA